MALHIKKSVEEKVAEVRDGLRLLVNAVKQVQVIQEMRSDREVFATKDFVITSKNQKAVEGLDKAVSAVANLMSSGPEKAPQIEDSQSASTPSF